MKQSVVIVGIGEMGSVFARGFLKAGYTVTPVTRQSDMQELAELTPNPELILIAVGESDLGATIDMIPDVWKHKIALLQNELLPKNWLDKNLQNPTVISVWFEKKQGMDYKVLVPSPVHGPKAKLIYNALATLNIPVQIMDSEADMLFELVRKNMYILTTNICGLETGGSVSQLWQDNTILMNKVFDDVLEIQQSLTGQTFNRDHLLSAVLTAFDGDPDHQCMGRSAPARLERLIETAKSLEIATPSLKKLDKTILSCETKKL